MTKHSKAQAIAFTKLAAEQTMMVLVIITNADTVKQAFYRTAATVALFALSLSVMFST